MINHRQQISSTARAKIQPFVVFIGNLEDDGKENEMNVYNVSTNENEVPNVPVVYVYINDNHRLNVPTNKLLDAVDACFKAIIVMNLDYAPEVKGVWSFFQRFIYQIIMGQVTVYKSILKMVNDLDAIEVTTEENENQDANALQINELPQEVSIEVVEMEEFETEQNVTNCNEVMR